MLRNIFLIAWRNLIRHKSFSIINILGLSIGITASLVIAVFVRYELSFDRHPMTEQTYRVVQETKFSEDTEYWSTTAYPLAEAIRNDFSELHFVTQAAGPMPRMFRVEDKSGHVSRFEEKYVLFVDPYYPTIFDFHWMEGDPKTALLQPASVVLTSSVAQKYFGQEIAQKESILGKRMMLNNRDELTVTGIVQDAPAHTSLKYNMLIPYEFFRVNNPYPSGNWSGNYQGTTFVVLKEGQSFSEFERQLGGWKKKYLKPEDDNRISYRLQPLHAIHTDGKFGSSPQSYVMPQKVIYAAIAVALIILVIACVNFINLATAQAASRAREVGIRKVMGSSKLGLVAQFLSENVLLVSVTLIVSLALTQLALSEINQLLAMINLRLALDWSTLVMLLLLGCFVIVLACFYPALVMASFRPVESLKAKFNTSQKGGLSLRRSLIVFQFSIVQLFIIGTLVIAAQLYYVKNKDLGFSKEAPIINTNLNELEKAEVFRQKLLTHSSIEEVSFSSSGPMSEYNHHYGTSFRLPGQREEAGKQAEEKGVDLNYLSFYKLELLAGRNFSALPESITEFIVNEKLVKELGWSAEQAIGQKLIINEGEANIVGVIKDFHNNSLQKEITPCVLLNSNRWLDQSNIKLKAGADLSETTLFIETTWKELYPEGICNLSFLDEAIAKKYALEQLMFKGFIAFSGLTIIIGCLGLYGLLSYVTIRKTREVGIRKVLGASVSQIVRLFSAEFIIMISVAFFIAAPLAYYFMTTWLQGFAYRIDLSWWMFALGAFLTFVITIVTIGYQSIKAALANPVDSLRTE